MADRLIAEATAFYPNINGNAVTWKPTESGSSRVAYTKTAAGDEYFYKSIPVELDAKITICASHAGVGATVLSCHRAANESYGVLMQSLWAKSDNLGLYVGSGLFGDLLWPHLEKMQPETRTTFKTLFDAAKAKALAKIHVKTKGDDHSGNQFCFVNVDGLSHDDPDKWATEVAARAESATLSCTISYLFLDFETNIGAARDVLTPAQKVWYGSRAIAFGNNPQLFSVNSKRTLNRFGKYGPWKLSLVADGTTHGFPAYIIKAAQSGQTFNLVKFFVFYVDPAKIVVFNGKLLHIDEFFFCFAEDIGLDQSQDLRSQFRAAGVTMANAIMAWIFDFAAFENVRYLTLHSEWTGYSKKYAEIIDEHSLTETTKQGNPTTHALALTDEMFEHARFRNFTGKRLNASDMIDRIIYRERINFLKTRVLDDGYYAKFGFERVGGEDGEIAVHDVEITHYASVWGRHPLVLLAPFVDLNINPQTPRRRHQPATCSVELKGPADPLLAANTPAFCTTFPGAE